MGCFVHGCAAGAWLALGLCFARWELLEARYVMCEHPQRPAEVALTSHANLKIYAASVMNNEFPILKLSKPMGEL